MILLKKDKDETVVLAEGSAIDILAELTFCVGKLYARLASGVPPEISKAIKVMLQDCFSDESPVWDVDVNDAAGFCIVTDKKSLRKELEKERTDNANS